MMRKAWVALAMLCSPLALGQDGRMEFLERAQKEFKTFDFEVDARAVNFDDPAAAALLASLRPGQAAVFSAVAAQGPGARCVVGWRASAWAGAPERLLEAGAKSFGGDPKAIWRLMIRHEFGHCALASLALDSRPRLGPAAEGFADVFALAWARRDGESESDLRAYVQGRALSGGGAGPGALERAGVPGNLARGQSPCAAAWTAFPWPGDRRPARKVCPGG